MKTTKNCNRSKTFQRATIRLYITMVKPTFAFFPVKVIFVFLFVFFFLNSLSPEIQFGYSQWRNLRHHALLLSENKATQLQFHDWNTRNSCPWTWQITCYSSFFLFFSISISFVSRFFPIFHEISYQANSNYLDF